MSSSSPPSSFPVEGGCVCKQIRYKMLSPPLMSTCCHCTWCQRETGSAFILNAMIEVDRVISLTDTKPVAVATPSFSGSGQDIYRCPNCNVAVWSDYGSSGRLRWVRVGTLDHPDACPPWVQIYTEHRLPWLSSLETDMNVPVFKQNYDDKESVWPSREFSKVGGTQRKISDGRGSLDWASTIIMSGGRR